MKKILTILLIGLACLSFASCNNDKESSEEVKKGDGSRFYAEITPLGSIEKHVILIQHGPAIKGSSDGVINTFCSKCIDFELVEKKWEKWLEEKEKKDKESQSAMANSQ